MSREKGSGLGGYFNPDKQTDPQKRLDDANALLLIACHAGDFEKVVEVVEKYNPDLNTGNPRALFWALNACNGEGCNGEKIIKYLIDNGAEVDFRHGPLSWEDNQKPYFVCFVADNDYASDEVVHFVVSKSSKEALSDRNRGRFEPLNAFDIIKEKRPMLYKKLVNEGLVDSLRR